ncbi:ABC transporter permease [Pedobacter ginsengisoli]|uniref:ABC transporter permease n=1 Tax=Pedobacter ginsengisoli TaxID=363852 RepID=A0A2D1U676_9SPHI|nr:ABC transporter permease [Pedobacter ginsengisoli]ATP57092.1 ABC transporter permease [Pedobacter ginsengisoli]
MFRLNLKIALRNLWKYKGYTFINIAGLAIGLAACLLIFIFLRYQTSFDKGYQNEDRIYRVVSSWTYPEGEFYSKGVPRPLAAAVRNDFHQMEKVAAIQEASGIIKVKATGSKPEIKETSRIYYTEPQFFDIIKVNWLDGEPHQALSAPNTVVLSRKLADKYFGQWKNAVGKSINFDNKTDFKVTGVIEDFPDNSSFPVEVVVSYLTYKDESLTSWESVTSSSECYVLLKKGVDAASLEVPMQKFIAKYYDKTNVGKEHHIFQPLTEIHYNEVYSNFAYKIMPKGQIIGLIVIGVFLLLTACINFINLATAQAISRSKEVGIRKVMGSLRKQLIWQFLSETTLITTIALLIACVLTELALPGMRNLFSGEINFSLFGHPVIFIFMIALILIVSFLAGFYPALIISGFSPALAIKNKISAANVGALGLRKALVVIQFAITAVLIIGTLVVVNQMQFMRNQSLGFDTNAIALVDVPSDSLSQLKFGLLKDKISKIAGVKSVSYCSAAPSSGNNNTSSFKYNSTKDENFQLNVKAADEDYTKTFSLKLIAGRTLSKSDTIKEFVVNETLLKKLNITNPNDILGKYIRTQGHQAPVVGVVKDFNNFSLHDKIEPTAIFSVIWAYNTIAIKLDPREMLPAMKAIEKEWNNTLPEYVYKADFMDNQISSFYETERVMGVLFKLFAGVVIFISFIGLFGLISFIATQRTKEIAIRKVLGASTIELIKMLNSSFLWMVLIANLIAWPVAYIFASKWLDGFAYRIPLSIWPFVLAMCISILITLITVSLRSYRAAHTNPIDALKYE